MLSALCPFLANYSAAVLTELEIFLPCWHWILPSADSLVCALKRARCLKRRQVRGLDVASIGACILYGRCGILLAAVGAYLFVLFVSAVLNRTGDTHKAPTTHNPARRSYSRH